jgi:hypothetical protein
VNPFSIKTTKFTELDRAKGRDNWAGLGLPGKGTPQGVSWSPYITSLTTGIVANNRHENILMYMDDGLLFAKTKEEMDFFKRKFEEAMTSIGVEIAPNKSGYIKENGIWLKDLKILGTRYDHQLDWLFSSTRSGTVTAMPRPDYKALEEHLEPSKDAQKAIDLLRIWLNQEEASGSKKGLINWLKERIARGPEFKALPTHSYGPPLGMTGKFLSFIWADPKKGDVKRLISDGQFARIVQMEVNKRSFMADLRAKGKWQVHDGNLEPYQLSTISTSMVRNLFEWHRNMQKGPATSWSKKQSRKSNL